MNIFTTWHTLTSLAPDVITNFSMARPTSSKNPLGWASHPLFGADLKTLWTVYRRSGGIKPSRRLLFILIILAAIGRLPFSAIEAILVQIKRRKQPEIPPVFILGHWRSGTTHLYNVMSKAERFGYVTPFSAAIPWDMLVIERLFAPLLRKGLPDSRYIDNVKVESDSPQEDELALANMTDLSYYHAIYFPEQFDNYFNQGTFFDGVSPSQIERWEKTLKYLYLKFSLHQNTEQLLIKNPVYTARPAHLQQMFPQAKFIHIHRHPYKIFVSMRNYFEKLLPQLALQDYDHLDIDKVIFKTYRQMMINLKAQTKDLPPEQYAEIGFEQFQADPMGELSRVYTQLNLGDFESDRPAFNTYLDSIMSYKKNEFSLPDELISKIDENWSDLYADWGYVAYNPSA